MSNRKWTQEPWEASDNESDTHPAFHDDRFGHAIAMSPYDYDRAIACVNAMAPFDDPSTFVATARADAERVRELHTFIRVLFESWSFSNDQRHTHTWHTREDLREEYAEIEKSHALTRKPAQEGAGG